MKTDLTLRAKALRPRLGVVVTMWSHEDGADYATRLVDLFPRSAPADQVEIIAYPTLLESEAQIPRIVEFFTDKTLDALCLIPGNFTLDHVMPLMAQAMNLPTVLWGLPNGEAWGALIAVQQTVFPFKELGLPYRFVIGELGDRSAWERMLPYLRGSALMQRLKGLRIGLMGWRAQGMSDMAFDELALRETFGVQVVNVGLSRYTRTCQAISDEAIEQAWREISLSFRTANLRDDMWRVGVRSYLAMEHLVAEEGLHAVTMECFPDHLGEPCLGFCLLNDEGIAAACESDVAAAVVMAAGQILSGEPCFHTDIFKFDAGSNTMVMGHCGNLPRALAADPEHVELAEMRGFGTLSSGPTVRAGPIVRATMKPGPVTAVNLVGRRGTLRLCAMEGEVLPYEIEHQGSWAKVAFPFDLTATLERIGNAGFGHHFVLIRGHIGRAMREWCSLLNVDHLSFTS